MTMIAPGSKSFFTRQTIKMITSKAKDTTYHFSEIPDYSFKGKYGLYIHVPFCTQICRFCPYYKVTLTAGLRQEFIQALLREISYRDMSGSPRWIYIGGGTPNVLSIEEWRQIFTALSQKISLQNIGIELSPHILSREYLTGLSELGVKKISIGIESFNREILEDYQRNHVSSENLSELIQHALSLGMWVNADIMLGFENQKIYTFRKDIESFLSTGAQQITIYPLMTIRGSRINYQTIDDEIQFRLIEEAARTLKAAGYSRRTLWTFTRGQELYDSSYDELGSDYLGLGASAISSTRGWVSVNLPLEGYNKSFSGPGQPRAFVNSHVKRSAHEGWRRFGMMLYERRLHPSLHFPWYLDIFILILMMSGYSFWGRQTRRGIKYAHYLTKSVVETKSFPIQHPGCVDNLDEYYESIKRKIV